MKIGQVGSALLTMLAVTLSGCGGGGGSGGGGSTPVSAASTGATITGITVNTPLVSDLRRQGLIG